MKRFLLVAIALSLVFSFGCTKREDLVVAKVNDRTITVGALEKASETMEEKYLPAANDLAGKKEFLDHMINKEIMALKATGAGYEKEEWFLSFWNQFKNPFVVAAMMDELIRKKVTVTDQEVKDYFDRMHNSYTLSEIVLPGEAEARRIRERLLAGEDFAELARKYSIAPDGADGGFVGENPIGKLLYWIEDALVTMKEGDISQPLQTTGGWAILRVDRMKQITPEEDLEWARKRVVAIKEQKGIAELKHKIEKESGLQFFPDAIEIAYNSLPPDIPMADIFEYRVTRENAPKVEIPDQYKDMILAQYSDGAITLKDFAELYDKYGLPERPRRDQGKQAVVDAVHKTIFDKILPVYAEEKAKILEVPSVKSVLDQRREQFLVYKLYDDQVRNQIEVTDKEIQDYYVNNMSSFSNPEQRDFTIVVVSSEETARDIAARAKKGEDFMKLAMKFSEDPSVKENLGKTGLTTKGHYPDYDAVAFSLAKGAVSDPFQVPRGWAIVKVEKIEAGKPLTLGEASGSIKSALMEQRAESLLMEKLKKWREDYTIKVNDRNLGKAELKRTRPQAPTQ